jgi:hypothetical protein
MGRDALIFAVALIVAIGSLAGAARATAAKDPFEAMAVHRPVEPVAAPDLAFLTAEGREARLGELRGKVVLLGFFTAT